MKYLLDTNVWLWSLTATERINKAGLAILASGEQELYLSVASIWEVTIKAGLGKLRLPEPPPRYVPSRLATQGIRSLSVNQNHALKVYELGKHHRDPFDRLLIAQAIVEDMTILTADSDFQKYSADVVWCG